MIEALDNIQATIDAPIIITASISNPTYKGQPGEKGDTPVKGVDYFTVEEVSEFKQDIENNLNLSAVATSGSYNDLSDKPSIPDTYELPVATATTLGGVKVGKGLEVVDGTLNAKDGTAEKIEWDKVSGKPEFATVATSGSYNDLVDKPTIPSTAGLASTTYVDNKVAGIVIPTVPTKVSAFENDANYATEQLVNTMVEAQNTAMVSSVRQVNERITNLSIPTKVSELENDSGYLTEHQSLENYITQQNFADGLDAQNTATNTLIRQVNERIDGITVPTKVSELENDSGYLTEHQSLADYSTTTEVQAMIDASAGEGGKDEVYVGTTAPTDTNIKLWVDTSASGSSTPSSVSWNDITDKPTIPSVAGLASEAYVNEKVAAIVIPTVPTKVSELENDAGYLTTHQSLAEYAKTADLAQVAKTGSYNDLADKPTIPSTTGLATETYVDSKIAEIVIPTVPTNVSAFTNDAGYLTEHQSLADYSTTAQVQTMISSAIGAITNGNEVSY